MNVSKRDLILRMAQAGGHLRPRDLQEIGISASYLQRLCEKGDLMRHARGVYMLTDAEITEHHTLAQTAKRVPRAVICLLSALRFHELGTENPARVWIALERGVRKPNPGDQALEVVRFSTLGMTEGLGEHSLEGVPVRLTTPARTIVDCFRYRNKIGLEPALEALRDGLRRKVPTGEIQRLARMFRMERIMRPYLEALL
jgi:predicted transcriptional regulator of viral defense system